MDAFSLLPDDSENRLIAVAEEKYDLKANVRTMTDGYMTLAGVEIVLM